MQQNLIQKMQQVSKLAAKSDLASLKAEVDKLDVDKLKNVPTNLSNLKSIIDKIKLAPFLLI